MLKISKQKIQPNQWDGGLTYEYFIYPKDSQYVNRNFDFRISSATIEKIPSNFTQFQGYFRYLVMLDNSLHILRNNRIEEYGKLEIFEFHSNEKIISNSLGNDFNLMISNRIQEHDLIVFQGSKVVNADWIILFALSETVVYINQIEQKLISNDCLLIENSEKLEIEIRISAKLIFATLYS